jgi:uncharacterized protein (TIGR02996 family)
MSTIAALEHRLITDPDAFDDWLVYADALAESGDPRGELVTIGVNLARGQGDPARLREREDALLQAHAEAWFGKFVEDDDWRECFGWTLKTGFWGRIRLWVDYDHSGTDIGKALAYALAHPSAKFLRELDLGLPSADGDAGYEGCIDAIDDHGALPSLRRLAVGDFAFPDESEISWVRVGNVGDLWPHLTGLEELRLQGANIGLGTPKSKSLRTLVLRTGGLPSEAGESLGRAELPNLEQLDVWFGSDNYGCTCSSAHARGILTNRGLPRLRRLALANAFFADEIADVVARTRLPETLEVLDLSMGTMSDEGAERLLARAENLRPLEVLDLSDNFLSPEMCARLQAALPNARVGEQRQSDGEWRYVSVGE